MTIIIIKKLIEAFDSGAKFVELCYGDSIFDTDRIGENTNLFTIDAENKTYKIMKIYKEWEDKNPEIIEL